MPTESGGGRLHDVLMDNLRRHRFPSPTMLDLTEQALPESAREEYLEILIQKIGEVSYPSPELIRRAVRFVQASS